LRASFIVSVIAHGLILAAALTSFRARQDPDRPRPVQVQIISPAELGGVPAGKSDQPPETALERKPVAEKHAELVPTAAEEHRTETVARKQAALPPPKPKPAPPPEPQKAVEKKPEPKPAESPPVPEPARRADAPKPRQEARRHEEKPAPREAERPEPKRQPAPRNDRIAELLDRPTPSPRGEDHFDPSRISALLNRDPTAGARPEERGERRPWRQPSTLEDQATGAEQDAPRREAYGMPGGRDQRLGADELAAFRAQIARCWSPPVGGLGGDAIIVKLRVMLSEDGRLTRPPELTNDGNSPFFRPAADSAIRAVLQCQPYRLAPEKFGQWRDMLLTFDPSRMYGG
jgi:outer membrane biosynthesis protein TonB